jgi:predicted enzyme related to lactoylglutathione lyase
MYMRKVAVAILLALPFFVASSLLAQEEGNSEMKSTLRINLTSVFVEDQEHALKFYTEVLGFVKKHDIPLGEYKWLTVVSAQDPDGTQLLLEPNVNEAARTFQKAIFDQGIPAASFAVDDIQKEFERLKAAGVKFTMEPTDVGSVMIAVFEDTCGNLIQIVQE